MSGGMHRNGANPGKRCYNKHCREKTFSDFPFCFFFIIFHNPAAKGRCPFCQEEKQKDSYRIFGECSSTVGERMRPRVRFGAHFAAKRQRKAARRLRKSEKQRCPAGEMRHPSL